LKEQILASDGLSALVVLLKEEGNLEGQRIAAKTLVNLVNFNPELRKELYPKIESVIDINLME
jgi:hypothetical protein